MLARKNRTSSEFNKSANKTKNENDNKLFGFKVRKWIVSAISIISGLSIITSVVLLLVNLLHESKSIYGENCSYGLCSNKFGLECINGHCICNTNSFYAKGCQAKKQYSEKCHNISNPCNDNAKLSCIDGVCKCDDLHYWNEQSCQAKQLYDGTCQSSDIQCMTSSLLHCEISKHKCLCTNNRY